MSLFIALILLLLSMPILADAPTANVEDHWFDVELILFSRQPGEVEEVWPKDPGTPDLTATITLPPRDLSASSPRFPFQPLSAADERLRAIRQRLEARPGIEVLGHLAWRQAAVARGLAPAVHVHLPLPPREPDDANAPPAVNAPDAVQETSASPETPVFDDTDGNAIPTDVEPVPVPGIDGRFRLSMNRYLHIDVDLLYDSAELASETAVPDDAAGTFPTSRPADNASPNVPGTGIGPVTPGDHQGIVGDDSRARYYRMRQSRRIKVGELHYFDHPYLGLLVLVEREEKPRATDDE